MNHVDKQQRGFTLIELMLAMAFVSTLLLAIAMIIVQIGSIYNKGITYTDVNNAGSSIANELQRSINESTPFNIKSGIGSLYVQKPWGGRLCTNRYSYIWNYGIALQSPENPSRNVYSDDTDIRFAKALDPRNGYCTASTSKVDKSSAVELLDAGQHNLVVHSFKISSALSAADTSTGQQLYSIVFSLGTNDQTALDTDPNTGEVSCKLPGDINANPLYCTISQFNLTARAGNEAK